MTLASPIASPSEAAPASARATPGYIKLFRLLRRHGGVLVRGRARIYFPIITLAVTALVLLYPAKSGRDSADLDRAERLLLDIKQINTQWSTDLLNLEMGLDTSYDQVTAPLRPLRMKLEVLEATLGHLDADGHAPPGYTGLMQTYRSAIKQKIELAEDIKSQYAILSNSSHFLPVTATDLEQAVGASGTSAESRAQIAEAINRVFGDTMSLCLSWDAHRLSTWNTDTDALRRLAGMLPDRVRQPTELLITHATIILTQRQTGMRLLAELTEVPVVAAVDDLITVCQNEERRLARLRALARDMTLAICSLLLAILGLAAWRSIREYRQLDRRNQRLKLDNDEAQLQLIQSAKMSALGQMVAGVAHEINTPLAYVMATFDVLRTVLSSAMEQAGTPEVLGSRLSASRANGPDGDDTLFGEIESLLTDGIHGVEQITTLVLAMKNFSRLDREKIGDFSVQEILDGALILTHHKSKYVADVEKEYQRLPNVYCSPSQINQVFVNILNNAVQAMAHQETRGTIRIRTSYDNDLVRVDIKDNGPGIPKDVLEKIFDPFFSTKPVGQGTGLGLSICYRIVHNHGGKILVDSHPGIGTTFSILLPTRLKPRDPSAQLEVSGSFA